MSVSCIQLLRLELRLAFRNGALRHQSPGKAREIHSISAGRWNQSLPKRDMLKYRLYSTTKPSSSSRRTLQEIERDMKKQQSKRTPEPVAPVASEAAPEGGRQAVSPRLLVYHARLGRVFMVGILNVTTLFGFGAACTVVAPAFFASENPWWTAPLVIICGAIPMLYVRFVTRPFVPWAHLVLPKSAQRSREAALEYSKNLPPNAVLQLGYIRYGLFSRKTDVEIRNLVPTSSILRPVTFKNIDPNAKKAPWWSKAPTEFYTSASSGTTKSSKTIIPGVWENVYKKITAGQELTRWRM